MALQDKITIITGTSRGIGKATATLLTSKGATVIGCSRYGNTDFTCDISKPDDISRLFDHVHTRYGRLDILVNNAAQFIGNPFMTLSLSDWDHLYQTNVRSVIQCCQLAFSLMDHHRGGSIINISSLAGFQGAEKFPGFSAYSTTKSAITGLTESLAVEGKPYHIRVNAIAPGAVDTQMLHDAAPNLKTSTTPEDIAHLIAFLADSTCSSHITGSIIPVYSNV
jgi:NAD(P)-dependent dehydrogenase (short-subunit alcohol dehydrogenase family)